MKEIFYSTGWLKSDETLREGLYQNLSYAEYDSMPALRSTYLTRMEEVPAYAHAIEDSEKEAFRFGRALHTFVLEGKDRFWSDYTMATRCAAIYQSGEKKNTQCKAGGITWDGEEFYCGQHNRKVKSVALDKEIISPDDITLIKAMNHGIRTHPWAAAIMQDGQAEVVIIWKDKETGLWCKARIDWLPSMEGVVTDLKSCQNANQWAFNRKVKELHYYVSAAMYLEGLNQVMNTKYEDWAWIASEKKLLEFPNDRPPITRCEVHVADPESWLQVGRVAFHNLLKKEALCKEKGNYPHYKNAGGEILFAPGYMEI